MPYPLRFNKLCEADIDDLSAFDRTHGDLNEFLKEKAHRERLSCSSVTRVAYYNDVPVGFFSIANASLRSNELYLEDGAGMREYPAYPAIKIVRMAVRDGYRDQGIGMEMLLRAMVIAKLLTRTIGCRFIIVDAKADRRTVRFYLEFGFRPQKSMYKAVSDVLQGRYYGERESIPMYLDILKR